MTRLWAAAAGTFALALAALAVTAPAKAEWKPERPITIIVPWAAGGSTDQVTRITAGEIEEALGQKVVVVNQPGGSGSIGTKSAMEAPADGYTWTAGAAKDLGTYIVSGLLETRIEDWELFLSVANQTVVGVNADAPFKDMGELLQAMKDKPGQVTVATAGVNSAGHYGIEAIARGAGVTYKHVSYDGGNPAVIATVSGETQVTTQLGVEQAEMIRAKRIRPLAVLAEKPLELEGYGTIPAIKTWLPGYRADTNYFGLFVPKGVPAEVKQALHRAWTERIAGSKALQQYAASKGALFAPVAGEAATAAVLPAVQNAAWLLHEAGKAKVSPDQVGIPKP